MSQFSRFYIGFAYFVHICKQKSTSEHLKNILGLVRIKDNQFVP